MGARPSQMTGGGGGRLNEVDGTITGYRLTSDFYGKPFEPGKFASGDPKVPALNVELHVTVDGAEEDTIEMLKMANNIDLFEITEDDQVAAKVDGSGCSPNRNTQLGKFLNSLCSAPGGPNAPNGFPESMFSDDPDSIDLRPMVGTRLRFTRQKYTAEELKAIEKFGVSAKKLNNKTGKEYDRDSLAVEMIHSLPNSKPVAQGRTITKAAGKPNGAAKEVDLLTVAGKACQEMLTKAGKPLAKAKLNTLVLTVPSLRGDSVTREAVRKFIASEENLIEMAGNGLIEYDVDSSTLALVS